jgi:hypothetical protein
MKRIEEKTAATDKDSELRIECRNAIRDGDMFRVRYLYGRGYMVPENIC